MNSVSVQSSLIILGVLLFVIVMATVITLAAYHSGGYIALVMIISLTVLIMSALMIVQNPEWLLTPKTRDQGMQAWTFVVFIVFGVFGIVAALFATIETQKKR